MFHGGIISRNKRSVNSKTEQIFPQNFGTFVPNAFKENFKKLLHLKKKCAILRCTPP
jgi:hypothetical protein